jgi:hypothetical protein
LKIFEYFIKRRGADVEKTNDRRGQIWPLGPNMAPEERGSSDRSQESIGHSVTEERETEESGRLGDGKWGRCGRWKLSIACLGFWPDEAESRVHS